VRDEAARRGVTPEEIDSDEIKLALAEQAILSPMFTIRNSFHTVGKNKEIVTVDPFIGQVILDITCESQRRAGSAERVIEIKPRQVGWTTWLLARSMWKGLQPNNTIVIMVPDDEVVKSINKRIGDIYNNLGWMTPMRRIENQRQIVFSNPDPRTRDFEKGLDTQISVVVPGPMRGLTPNTLILSEFAHVRDNANVDPSDMLDAVLTGMSKGPESAVYIDTTPNGYDDDYYPMVIEAIERNPRWVKGWDRKPPTREEVIAGILGQPDNPEEGWVPVFMSCLWHEEYRTRDEHPKGQRPAFTQKRKLHLEATLGKEEEFGGEEELELHKKYGASLGFLDWRRYTIRNDTQGFDIRQKLLTFRQEYAVTWDSCFVDYGHSAFDPLGLDAVSRMVRNPAAHGILERKVVNGTQAWEIVYNPYEWDEMRFWAPAEPSEKYVIGVDLGWSFESVDADQTYACVIRRRDRKQVAVYESRAPMHRVREMLYRLYRYYNDAFLGIETKGPGKNLVFELFQMGARNQYRWKRLDVEVVEDTKFLGWETSQHTRGTMEGIVAEEIARRVLGRPEPGLILRDKKTIDQLKMLKRFPGEDRLKGRGSAKDDAVDALMIAMALDRDPMNPYVPPRAVQQAAVEGTLYSYQRLQTQGKLASRNEPTLKDL
jgi:hypothetical protein